MLHCSKVGSAYPVPPIFCNIFLVIFTPGDFLLRDEKCHIGYPRFLCLSQDQERERQRSKKLKRNNSVVNKESKWAGWASSARQPGSKMHPLMGKLCSPNCFYKDTGYLAQLSLPPQVHSFNPISRMLSEATLNQFTIPLNWHIFRVWQFQSSVSDTFNSI